MHTTEEKVLGFEKARLGTLPPPRPGEQPARGFQSRLLPRPVMNGPGALSARGLNGALDANPRSEVSAQKPLSRWFWSSCVRGGPGDQPLCPQHDPRSQRGPP